MPERIDQITKLPRQGDNRFHQPTAFRLFGLERCSPGQQAVAPQLLEAIGDLPRANDKQAEAVALSLGNDVAFIWGPPGTGKTTTLARVVAGLVASQRRTLVLSHTNVATDRVVEQLQKVLQDTADWWEVRILRIGTPQLRTVQEMKEVNLDHIVERKTASLRAEQDELRARRNVPAAIIVRLEEIRAREEALEQARETLTSTEHDMAASRGAVKASADELAAATAEVQRLTERLKRALKAGFFGRVFRGLNPETIKGQLQVAESARDTHHTRHQAARTALTAAEPRAAAARQSMAELETELRSQDLPVSDGDWQRRRDEVKKQIDQIDAQLAALQ